MGSTELYDSRLPSLLRSLFRRLLPARSILSIALSVSIPLGWRPRKPGAALTTTSAASQRSPRPQQTLTTVPMASRTGRLAGQSARRLGAARSTERAAPARATAARLCPAPRRLRTIAMQASPIGLPAGVHQRRRGAARMQARVASRTEDVHEVQPRHVQGAVCAGAERHLPAYVDSALEH